jgi:Zn-dependent peptidase ImmA (M78 family)
MPVMESSHSKVSLTVTEAQAIIRAHQKQAPVNVTGIASELGLKIYATKLPESISGKIIFEAREQSERFNGYVIYVNQAETFERQRFTAAHEIAHFILHRHLIGDGITDDVLYRSKLTSPQETEANNLAADILMPWNLINETSASGVTNIRELAARFQVSLTAMSVRLGMPT